MATNETKWTPGPWQRNGKLGYAEWIVADPGDGDRLVQIATVYGPRVTPQSEANANLITAAPDLYEALAELVARRERACREQGGPVDGSDGRYARARAALAKARGEGR